MLARKSLTANITSSAGGTGQNTLYYDTTTKSVKYTTVPLAPIYNPSSAISDVISTTGNTYSGTVGVFTTYLTSAGLPPGTYFVMASYNFTGTGGGQMRVQLRNNQSTATFGDYGVISLQVTGITATGSTSGVSTLTVTSNFSFQFTRTTGTNVTIRGASLTCFRLS